jgi:hypothetical protein
LLFEITTLSINRYRPKYANIWILLHSNSRNRIVDCEL